MIRSHQRLKPGCGRGLMSELKLRPPKEKSAPKEKRGGVGSRECISEMERLVIPRIPPYAPVFADVGETKGLRVNFVDVRE